LPIRLRARSRLSTRERSASGWRTSLASAARNPTPEPRLTPAI